MLITFVINITVATHMLRHHQKFAQDDITITLHLQ